MELESTLSRQIRELEAQHDRERPGPKRWREQCIGQRIHRIPYREIRRCSGTALILVRTEDLPGRRRLETTCVVECRDGEVRETVANEGHGRSPDGRVCSFFVVIEIRRCVYGKWGKPNTVRRSGEYPCDDDEEEDEEKDDDGIDEEDLDPLPLASPYS